MTADGEARRARAARLARTVERLLGKLHGRPFVLSPKDWAIVDRWSRSGIPVELVAEEVESRRRRPPRSLSVIADTVERSWDAVGRGLVVDPTVDPDDDLVERPTADARQAFVEALAASGDPTASWHAAVCRVLHGTPPAGAGDFEDAVDRALLDHAPARDLEDATRQAERRLLSHRHRMTGDRFEATRRRAIARRLRARLGLPERRGA